MDRNEYTQFFELLGYVFQEWISPGDSTQESRVVQESRSDCPSVPKMDRLLALHFDKLGVVCHRFWNATFEETKSNISEDVSHQKISQPFPFQEFRGVHGRGLALKKPRSKPNYMINILNRTQILTGNNRFDFIGKPGDSGDLTTDSKLYVMPSATITSELFNNFNSKEARVAKDLAMFVSKLNPEEIRAIGTHDHRNKMIEDLIFEFEKILVVIPKMDGDHLSKDLLHFCDELVRKSGTTKHSYEAAYQKAMIEVRDPDLKSGIVAIQATAEEIWGAPEIRTVHADAIKLLELVIAGVSPQNKLANILVVNHGLNTHAISDNRRHSKDVICGMLREECERLKDECEKLIYNFERKRNGTPN
ncbi:MAG: hypothetical protein AAF431_10465 [Pseudomonadota bacterium]